MTSGAAGVAGLALFAAASSLSPTVVPEGGEYRGLGIGQDGIVRVGFPAGGEQCTNQISRRFSITTCTPSTRRLLDGVAVRFSDRAAWPVRPRRPQGAKTVRARRFHSSTSST